MSKSFGDHRPLPLDGFFRESLYSNEMTARLLGISLRTLFRLRASGTNPLPFVRIGARTFVKGSDIAQFLADNTHRIRSRKSN